MALVRVALSIAVVGASAAIVVSGGSGADPRTPQALLGLPPPFLGVAIVGSGARTMAVDAYGNVVELRAPGPAGRALLSVPAARQKAGTVPADAGIGARMQVGGRSIPLWGADSVRQRYVPGSNVLRTVARAGDSRAVVVRSPGGPGAARADRRWLSRARPLGGKAPPWARRMHARSLLVLRALADRRTGAVAAGARDGWAYVWPRDAGAVAIALASAGYRAEARRIVRFLLGLDLGAAARFQGDGSAVEDRAAQGDASGWAVAAARYADLPVEVVPLAWRARADYQEGDAGDYLGNAIASADRRDLAGFAAGGGLVRREGDSASGLDSSAAWAVRPFPRPALFPLVRRTLLRLAAGSGRFGILPSESWEDGEDPWTAPTAWTAWGLAALGERRAALHLMAALRRASTPLGMLPERVDARTGVPASTTPLAWSHAFAILALRELWP
jgi:glucoamylase